jgi:hypothetical protein
MVRKADRQNRFLPTPAPCCSAGSPTDQLKALFPLQCFTFFGNYSTFFGPEKPGSFASQALPDFFACCLLLKYAGKFRAVI